MNETVLNKLERRLGGLHSKQRLGIEKDHEAQFLAKGSTSFTLKTGIRSTLLFE